MPIRIRAYENPVSGDQSADDDGADAVNRNKTLLARVDAFRAVVADDNHVTGRDRLTGNRGKRRAEAGRHRIPWSGDQPFDQPEATTGRHRGRHGLTIFHQWRENHQLSDSW
nr:hypothetical protein [Fodinicola acaciae]